jgi:eukaryotic-like serine/threonine-protein kinase
VADAHSAPTEAPRGVDARIGTVVDKYTIVRVIGRGGMGAVYEARHARTARRFAIKFLLPEFASNRDVLRRFENEAKAAGGLEHFNLAGVTDVGQAADGAPYLVMEFLEGEDGAKLLRRYGPLPVARAVDIALQTCRGLAVAHRAGIVHRDLKPENIFLVETGDGRDQVKVLDFGIAKLRATDTSVATGTGATFGTAFYMAPEQARGAGDVDHRADVWSLGVVLYELLSGRKPFEGGAFLEVIHKILTTEPPSLDELRPGLPPALVALVHQSMRKEVLERLPSVVTFAERLVPFAITASGSAPSGLAATAPSAPTFAIAPVTAPTAPAPVSVAVVSGAEPTRSRRGLVIALVAIFAIVAASAAAFLSRAPTPTAAPTVAPPSTPAPPAAAVPAAPPHPSATASPTVAPTDVLPAAPQPAAHARTGQSSAPHTAHRTNASEHVRFVGGDEAAAAPAPTPPPAPAAKPAPAAQVPRAGHPIDIEKDNPYGN